MSQKPLVVVTDHLAEAGVEKPVLDGIADILLLQTGHGQQEYRELDAQGNGFVRHTLVQCAARKP